MSGALNVKGRLRVIVFKPSSGGGGGYWCRVECADLQWLKGSNVEGFGFQLSLFWVYIGAEGFKVENASECQSRGFHMRLSVKYGLGLHSLLRTVPGVQGLKGRVQGSGFLQTPKPHNPEDPSSFKARDKGP